MDEFSVPDGEGYLAASSSAPAPAFGTGPAVPWLEGALVQYLAGGAVLDIKAADDPEAAPVTPGATVIILPDLAAHDGSASLAAGYDAIFSRNVLGLANDPRTMLANWFRMLRTGGHMVVVLPHAEASGPDAEAPGSEVTALVAPPALADRCLPASMQSVMRMVEAALPAECYRIVRLDTAQVRGDAARVMQARTEIRLVLQKLTSTPAEPAGAAPMPLAIAAEPEAEAVIPFALARPVPVKAPGMRAEGTLLIRDFGPHPAKVSRILVLKLDHHGDFIIGLPALRELRQAFPDAYIRLICGRWNVASARASGLVDDVRSFDFFTERAADWTGVPTAADWKLFAAAVEGRFDLAIDLRVDDDTRALLGRVDARVRCGIGSQTRFPLLDIALPDASRETIQPAHAPPEGRATGADGAQVFRPDIFASDMEIRTEAYHETRFTGRDHCVLRSDAVFLPTGSYSAEFELSTRGFVPGWRGVGVGIEVIANDEHKIADKWIGRRSLSGLSARQATLVFDTTGEGARCRFRVHMSGKPLSGRLRFGGLRLRLLTARGARFRPSELHIGEKLSLLVSLIRQRTLALAAGPELSLGATPAARQDGTLSFVLAPFSNSSVRDWPVEQYAALIEMLTTRYDCHVSMVGSPAQSAQARQLMTLLRGRRGDDRVVDRVGKTQWSDLGGILRAADLVICNNSGIAHQAADLGSRTLALYSASHQPLEWGPRGPRSRAIMMNVACSPCGYERVEHCSNDHLCMRLMTPEIVMAQVAEMLAGDA